MSVEPGNWINLNEPTKRIGVVVWIYPNTNLKTALAVFKDQFKKAKEKLQAVP